MSGENSISKRLPNAAWAWEFLRRNKDYRLDYRLSRAGAPSTIQLKTGATLRRGRRRFLTAERWGLLFFANPKFSAAAADVFWLPELLTGALRVRLSLVCEDVSTDADDHDIIVLSAIRTRRILYEAVDGARHILLNGDRFWIQLHCENPAPLGDQARVGIRIDGARHAMRRLDTAAQLLSLHRSAGGKLSLIGRRRNSKPLANALSAYDIWHGFERPRGGLKEVAEMINGPARIATDWGVDDRALKQQAHRAIAKGEAIIANGYRNLLAKKTL